MLPPLSLYVHLPWCVRKCPYCDFNSHQARGDLPQAEYIDALLQDLETDLPLVWGRPVTSIFIGGGTPSLFEPRFIERLLAGIASRISLRPGLEVTMEINPGTVEHAPLPGYVTAGVNRASLGIQSFDDAALERIGRIHDAGQARDAAAAALEAGFDSVNLDLMYGLPGQTVAGAESDVAQALALGPQHLSHYQLTLEPNTLFHSRPPQLPDEDRCWDMQGRCGVLLRDAGYENYEVSAWSRPGHACRHNLNYWRFGDYLGIGAGAHAKLTLPASDEVVRLVRQRHPQRYLSSPAERVIERRSLDAGDRVFEFMLNQLRLAEPFGLDRFEARTGLARDRIEPTLTEAAGRGWLTLENATVTLTASGSQFLNNLLELFVPEVPAASGREACRPLS